MKLAHIEPFFATLKKAKEGFERLGMQMAGGPAEAPNLARLRDHGHLHVLPRAHG